MTILLDIDGVLVTTPSWKIPEFLEDGFMKFNENASSNLNKLIKVTNAQIILTTTHRHNYSNEKWIEIFANRNIIINNILKVNVVRGFAKFEKRSLELLNWVNENNEINDYLIIDDDLSLHELPNNIKCKCIQTLPLIGFNNESLANACSILNIELKELKD